MTPLTKIIALVGGLLTGLLCLTFLFAWWGTMARLGKALVIGGGLLAGLFCLLVLSTQVKDYEVAKTVEHDPNLPHFILGNVVLHGETFGSPENPTVIVVHGGPGLDYRSLLPLKALSDEFFVVFYDQRGTGLSPRVGDDQLNLESYLADLDSLVDRFSAGRKVNLVGHSWGGKLVSSYVGRHPEKVSHVVMAEPGPLNAGVMVHYKGKVEFSTTFKLHVAGSWLLSLFASGPDSDAAADWFQYQIMAGFKGEDHPLAGYFCKKKLPPIGHWRVGRRAWIAVRDSYTTPRNIPVNFVQGMERFHKEVLFITGACNVMLGPEFQREQMKYFPRARMVVIEGVGHQMFWESPAASIAPVREYLRWGRTNHIAQEAARQSRNQAERDQVQPARSKQESTDKTLK